MGIRRWAFEGGVFGDGERTITRVPQPRASGRRSCQSGMEIIKLDPRQLKKRPMFSFYFPDPGRRTRYLPWYFRNILNCAMRYGAVSTTPEIAGGIFILPPGHTKLSMREYVRNGFLPTPLLPGFTNYHQSMDCERFVGDTRERIMKNRPHFYLWGLAVDPSPKAKGIGAALMLPLRIKADAQKIPVFLETHDEKNVRYYQRHGFTLVYTGRIPKYELPIWCMLRQPV
jgi:ribosomal protein S18 acetylase RimI-like enzyme